MQQNQQTHVYKKNVSYRIINYKHVSIGFAMIIIAVVLQTVLRTQQTAEFCNWIHSAFDGCLKLSIWLQNVSLYILLKIDKI